MKSKLLSTFGTLRVLMVAALTVFCVSCDKTETTDSTGFILYYMGVTDIGPGLSYDLQAPAYKGSAPYDFTITNITLDEETFSNDENFVINTETGAIAIQNTGAIASGLYSISVGCYSNGKFFEFKDAVQVNMLLAAPEGVTIEPDKIIVVNQDEEKWAETSAQVTTEKDKHISILGYAIAQDESKPYLQYFDVTSTGKIIIKEGVTEDQLIAGEEYTLSLKLTTKVGDHMFADAVTFKIVSKPRKLVYSLNQTDYDLFEARLAGESSIPQLKGGKEDLKFAIKSINPEISGFSINEENGQISLPENHEVPANKDLIYSFTITVSNSYGSTDFESVYAAKVTDYVKPIDPDKFSYTTQNLYQLGGELTAERNPGFEGDAVEFSFAEENTDEEILAHKKNEIIKVDDGNGTITIANNHTLSAGSHEIKVKVTNMKNKEGIIKSLSVNVLENPNYFTYIDWGNNIEHEVQSNQNINIATVKTQNEIYRNQFRFIHRVDVTSEYEVKGSDIKDDNAIFNYTIVSRFGGEKTDKFSKTEIDSNNGKITMGDTPLGSSFEGGILLIKVTVTNATQPKAPAFVRNIPIFFNTPKVDSKPYILNGEEKKGNQTMICTPFVIKANPKTGKCSNFTTQIIGANKNTPIKCNSIYDMPKDKFVWEYHGPFTYCNFDNNDSHKNSTPLNGSSKADELLYQVWENCSTVTKTKKDPMRYYNEQGIPNITDLNKKACYLDQDEVKLVVIPDKIKGKDNQYAYGAMLAQLRYNIKNDIMDALKATTDNPSNPVFPLIIWFDETYEGN